VAEYIGTESADDWLHRVDRMLYAAKAGGRNRICVDRRGNSDLAADRSDVGLLRLTWLESYECGEPTIDAEHRELFDLGNALMAAAIKRDPAAAAVPAALNALLQHVARHFRDEEAVLALHGYRQLAAHKRAHASLLRRAGELKAAVDGNRIALGTLVNFIVRDVIAGHLFKADRQFFPLFQRADVGAIGTLTR
jgi:hemerythrin